MTTVDWKQFKELETLVDIRPAHEYAKSHIPDAISLPFPIDLKKLKKDYGASGNCLRPEQILHYVTGYSRYVESLKKVGCLLGLYCQNGGWRSLMLSKILEYPVASIQLQCGMGNRKELSGSLRNIQFLKEGFNLYLDNFYHRFNTDLRFVRICGLTGSGKTQILNEIYTQGGQILDLELLAMHSGSAFGGIAKGKQPDQWSFEQKLLLVLESLDLNRPVFVEQKGGAMGSLHIPSALARKLNKAPAIVLEVPKSQRIANLVQTYGKLPKKSLENAIDQIAPRLGNKGGKEEALTALKRGNLKGCAAVLLSYYDHTLVYSQENEHRIRFTTVVRTAKALLDEYGTFPITA